MADSFTLALDDRELAEQLLKLAKQVGMPTLKNAGRAGARVFEKEQKLQCPVVSGKLKKSITIRMRMRRKVHIEFVIGPTAPHAHFVELGVSPHPQPKRGHDHPGSRPNPFIRRSFDQKHEKARQRARAVLVRAINKVQK